LIDDQQRLGLADRQIAADRIGGLARVGEIDALAQSGALLRRAAEPLGRLGHAALEAFDRIAAGAHDDDVPEPVVGLAAGQFGELAAAKRRDETSLRERGLAGAAVRHDGDQAVRFELVDELADLLVAAEEPIRVRFGHRLEPDEGVFENDGLFAGRAAEYSAQQLGELLGIVERVADALVLPRERRQRGGARALCGQNRDEGIVRAGRARQREPNLRFDPVHDTSGADMNRECGGVLGDRILELNLPAGPGRKIVLVEPDAQAGGARIGTFEQTALQFPRGIGVRARVTEEENRRGIRW
jgi:hypothetical protein